ncbi:MAG: enoyl-CoA hydratase/isomerase family protein [Thermoanaerobaculia bacterium]|nr:enoyl-CoA hydratase/isomerase family protein [Thermoanaerobaculia bacterium]
MRERREGDLLWLTLDDPQRANALSPELIEALTAVYRRPLLEEGIRAILLAGAGKHFSAGADLAHLRSLKDASLDDNRADSKGLRDLFYAILSQEALTISLVQGACIAGGCGLASAHDFVIAAANAKFMYSEVKIGFVAALVATFLPLRVSGRDARELLLNPSLLGAEEALRIGLINRVHPGDGSADQLAQAGESLASEILANASSQSLARTKRLMLSLPGHPLEDALDHAAEQNAQARLTEDCQRGIAHFLEHKTAPTWR